MVPQDLNILNANAHPMRTLPKTIQEELILMQVRLRVAVWLHLDL